MEVLNSKIDDCYGCRGWRNCPGKAWYSFGEIRWCPQQDFWILKHAYELESGIYPDKSGLDQNEARSGNITHEPEFVKSTLLIAQVRLSLKPTGWRGRLLAAECLDPRKEKLRYLSDDAKAALYYIAGSKPNPRKFSDWMKDRDYYRKRVRIEKTNEN